ncbi:MAG: tetratricopeptide repeat protein [Candidatus Kariarchaeaceae archaeon]
MSKKELQDLSETVLESLDHVELLLKKGKIKEAMEIIEGRGKEEGIEELRWRIAESRCRNRKGEFDQVTKIAKEIIKELVELEEPLEYAGEKERIKIDALIEHIWALQRLGKLDEGIEKVEEGIRLIAVLEERKEKEGAIKDKERKVALLNNKGILYLNKGELDQAIDLFKDCLTINEEIGAKKGIAAILNNIGIIYWQKGEMDQTLDYWKKSLAIREELGNKQDIAASLNNIGALYDKGGELDKSMEFYKKSLKIKRELGNKQDIAASLNNIGGNYRQKGELKQALDYYEKSLVMREEVGNKYAIACSLSNIGDLYQETGALESALDLLKQSLLLFTETGNKIDISSSLFRLICLTIDLDIDQAKDYFVDLQLINEQEENKRIDQQSRLAEALILKKSKRRKNLTKAEEILEEIVEEDILSHDLTVRALINLSELLLDELNSTGEETILVDLEEKVEKLMEIAKKQQSYTRLTESYWLKAQIALVRLDLKEARNLLTQAQAIAEDKGLERLARKISSEHDQLLEQMDQWEELIVKDASITERVKVANLDELVGWMARKREIKIEEKEDEPVMLLLVSESGLPIYSKHFDESRALKDILISGFLTSINTFVKEAFHAPGMIRRIMHDEYTLSFDLVDPILFCYVYEGQSYTAMKKLEQLITNVHDSEIWSSLEEVGKKGYKLRNGEIAQMEGIIENIFLTNYEF